MKILDRFADAKILVVGDVMLDRYWWGSVDRISPEAPVPVVRLQRTTNAPGGAANVAANLAGLEATPILIGIVGNDEDADIVRHVLIESNVSPEYLIRIAGRRTTVKTRVIAHSQQVARIDQETDDVLSPQDQEAVLNAIRKAIEEIDIVVISDYAKGTLTEELVRRIIEMVNGLDKQILVDPKGKHYIKYRGATLITPNRREAAEACNIEHAAGDLVNMAGSRLLSELECEAVLITEGENGMTLFQKDRESVHFQAVAQEVYDVTGAGDTVIAMLAAALSAGGDFETAAKLANIAAGLAVTQVGTTSISLAELRRSVIKL